MRETSLIELGRGMATVKYLRPRPLGEKYRFTDDHVALEVPISGGLTGDEELVTEAKRGNRLRLIPEWQVDPQKYRVLVVPHQMLHQVAELGSVYLIDPCDGEAATIQIYARFFRDFDLTSLPYLCRLYMLTG